MQILEIQNFGPIPYCKFEVKDFMIFIGEQSTGKSTICKSIYFFKSIRDEVVAYLHNVLNNGLDGENRFPNSVNEELQNKFKNLFGLSEFKNDFNLHFEYDKEIYLDINITQDDNRDFNFNFSKKLFKLIRELEEEMFKKYNMLKQLSLNEDSYIDLERHRFFSGMENDVHKMFNDNRDIYYIPAGRGLLSLLTNQLLNIEVTNLDYITSNFMKLIQKERKFFDLSYIRPLLGSGFLKKSGANDEWNSLSKHVADILKGKYVYNDGKEYLTLANNLNIPINFASSGQQEILWILNLIHLWLFRKKKVSVIIEEPEAHLFPNAQREVMNYISLLGNANNNQILITTHSPYILTSSNNLLYAGKIGEKQKEQVNEIIPTEKWINPNRFDAMFVGDCGNEYVRSIIDSELGEIAAEEIDRVSQKIRNEYSDIYNLEVDNEF